MKENLFEIRINQKTYETPGGFCKSLGVLSLFCLEFATLDVNVADETVWLNRQQLAVLFGRDVKTIGKHIGNALKEELDESTVAKFAIVEKLKLRFTSD